MRDLVRAQSFALALLCASLAWSTSARAQNVSQVDLQTFKPAMDSGGQLNMNVGGTGGHLTARGLYATHNTVLAVAGSLAGFGVTIAATLLLVDSVGILAIPLGFAAGMATKVALQAVALGWRIRTAPAPETRADEEPETPEAA